MQVKQNETSNEEKKVKKEEAAALEKVSVELEKGEVNQTYN